METQTNLSEEDFNKLISLGRKGLIMIFVVLVIMLFHVLIDIAYHT